MNLKDKVVIVTGGARGIGQAIALRFAREKARVAVADILDGAETAEKIASVGGQCLVLKTDVTSEQSTLDMAKKTVERFGRIDVLVNNAGLIVGLLEKGRPRFWEISAENWDKMLAVNLKGVFLCSKAVFPVMREQGRGKIVNIASSIAFSGAARFAHYGASKGGVVSLTRIMAREAGEYNINVNAVAPGLVMSKMVVNTIPREFAAENVARRCLKRDELPEDLVGTVAFLSSEDSDFITGQVIVVDGGMTLH